MVRGFVTAVAGMALVLAGCAGGSDAGGPGTSESPSASLSSPAAMGNGAVYVFDHWGSDAQRYPIGADGVIGPPVTALPWESGADAEATLLKDAMGTTALTSTVELPLTDVSATTQLQVRDVVTGEVRHQIDVGGWCSGPDGASYPCLLLDENRMVRSTPIDGERPGTITISSTTTGETLAVYGPFPALAGVNPTTSPDAVVVVTYDSAGKRHLFQRLDTRTGETSDIGTIPTEQPWFCILGTDSVLTYTTTLGVIGPAEVAAVEVPELVLGGPGAVGCSADGKHLYVRTDYRSDPDKQLVLDAVSLTDGTRTTALTIPSQEAPILVTR